MFAKIVVALVNFSESKCALRTSIGVQASSAIVEGREVRAILHYLKEAEVDLLVIGLHQHDF
jgi:hypothetical protein